MTPMYIQRWQTVFFSITTLVILSLLPAYRLSAGTAPNGTLRDTIPLVIINGDTIFSTELDRELIRFH
ncbi:MAG: hypothetical protein D6800_05735, partial [Candidatus Zixiibacteriota bacterium]